jgi:hypothetical protein
MILAVVMNVTSQSRDWATVWMAWFRFPGEAKQKRYFLFAIESRPALGPTQSPIQWVPGSLTPRAKQLRREAHHSLLSIAEVKNAWSYASTPTICLHGVVVN